MEIRTYNDPIKQKSREKIREFIGNYFKKDPSKLKVLCFPGAEVDGEEALEVKEVYDQLRIPRKNITGLEYNRHCADRLIRANLGIEVRCQDDISFLQETDRTFDIISLDYTSNFNEEQVYVIDLITSKKLLGEKGVLVTNYFGAREDKSSQFNLTRKSKMEKSGVTYERYFRDPQTSFEKIRSQEVSINDSRSKSIQDYIGGSFENGLANLNPFLFFKMMEDKTRQYFKELIEDGADNPKLKLTGRDKYERLARAAFFRDCIKGFYNLRVKRLVGPEIIHPLLYFYITRPYLINAHESYSYISNKRSPMFMDIWGVEEAKIRDDYFSLNNGEINFLPNLLGRKREEIREKAERLTGSLIKSSEKINVERQFLGSSYVPRIKEEQEVDSREAITKDDVMDLLASGIPPKEIAETFSGFTKMQLAAFKAHITMGTYNRE